MCHRADATNVFSLNSYLHIMPTILRVYSNYQSNKMVVTVIEFIVKQLYILHRKPFILQMLGSVAPILDMDENAIYGDANKVSLYLYNSRYFAEDFQI